MELKKLNKIKLHTLTCLYGEPGSGKTTLINSLPGEVLVIDTDRGLASVTPEERFSVAECYTWSDVEEAINLANDFDSIAIDHFTNVQELLYKDLMEKKNTKKMSLQLYGEASIILRSFIDTLV